MRADIPASTSSARQNNDGAAHTSGPWELNGVIDEAGDEAGAQFIVGGKFGGLVGAAMAWPTELDSGDFSRVKANACLMASAPELLDALKAMLAHSCVADADPNDKDAEDHDAERMARAAIKKATGT